MTLNFQITKCSAGAELVQTVSNLLYTLNSHGRLLLYQLGKISILAIKWIQKDTHEQQYCWERLIIPQPTDTEANLREQLTKSQIFAASEFF